MKLTGLCLLASLIVACSSESGPVRAGLITEDNAADLLFDGALAEGAPGDTYLRNDRLVAIIEKPGRVFGTGPYGGNLIDIGDPATRRDALSEAIPFFQFGRTIDFKEVRVVNDGSDGGPAVVEAVGQDAIYDFLNVQAFAPGLLRYQEDELGRPIGILKFDPLRPVPMAVVARYTLGPDASHVEVRYTVYNRSDDVLALHAGFGVDMRGEVEPFAPGRGFTEPGADVSDIGGLLGSSIDSPYIAYQGDGFANGIVSRDFLDGAPTPRLSVAILGIAIVLLGSETPLDLLSSPGTFEIAPHGSRSFGFDLLLAEDVGEVDFFARGRDDWGTVVGRVTDAASGEGISGVRIAAIDPDNGAIHNAFVSDPAGNFDGRLPPGTYHIVADDLSRPLDAGRLVTLSAGETFELGIELQPSASVGLSVRLIDGLDNTTPVAGPCRVALLGAVPERTGGICGQVLECDTNSPFRHPRARELETPLPYIMHTLSCDTSGNLDTPLRVIPGRYVAVVSRGPEYDVLQQLIDVGPGEQEIIEGTLRRVVDSTGLVASEFHVHQVRSPDSVVPNDDRLRSIVASGVEFFASTDHDSVTDLRPRITSLGLDRWVAMVPGVESSPPDLGHFNSFPIEPLPNVQNGGPPDWGGAGRRPTPKQFFDLVHARGAQVVQINHPRGGSFFDTLDLQYDLEGGRIFANPETAPPMDLLLMDPDLPLFPTNFDAMEIYNGSGTNDQIVQDWFNFLSMGLRPTGTAVSDTHSLYSRNPGEPRTYVVSEREPAQGLDVAKVVAHLKAGHAFGSSGPIVRAELRAGEAVAGIGDLLSPAAGAVQLVIHAETPSWYGLSVLEVYVAQSFAATDAQPLTADLTVALVGTPVTRAHGGTARLYDATVDIPAELLPQDGWVIARLRGPGTTQYPVSNASGSVTLDLDATTVEEFAQIGGGREPFAFTNPIFVDRNGNGRYDPRYPLR